MKKLFTLLTLALISIGSAWGADEVIFKMIANVTADMKISAWSSGDPVELDLSDGADITPTGSTAVAISKKDKEQTVVKNQSSGDVFNFGVNDVGIRISFAKALQIGDVITAENANNQICFTETATRATTIQTSSGSYTIPEGSDLIGATTLYVWRVAGSGTTFKSLTISRPSSAPDKPTLSVADGSIDGGTAISISGDGTIYYQWSSSATTPEIPSTLPGDWAEGESTTAPNETGNQYLYAFAHNSIGNSDIVKGTYSITKVVLDPALSYEKTSYSIFAGNSFTTPTLKNPHDLAVTYSLTGDDGVATVDGTSGDLTLLGGGGTVTVTASCVAQGDYDAGSASYTLTVIDLNTLPTISNKMWNISTWDNGDITSSILKDDMYVIATSDKKFVVENNNQIYEEFNGDNKFTKRLKFGGTSNSTGRIIAIKVAKNSRFTFYAMKGGSSDTRNIVIGTELAGGALETIEIESNEKMSKKSYNYTGDDDLLYIYCTGNGVNLYAISVEPILSTVDVTVGKYQWATFCSSWPLDFTESGVKAYIVTGDTETAIEKEEVTKVAAYTPLLLNAVQGNYTITVAAEGTDYSSTNLLQRGTGTLTKPSSGSAWVLGVEGEKAMFQYIDGTAADVPTSKAYLLLDSTPEARSLFLDDDVTGIKNIKVGSEDNIYYDLQGRRVLYPTKGLYIVNGKKVILK